MSDLTYNLLAQLLLLSSLASLAIAAAYLIAMFIGWKGRYRKARFVRFLAFLLLCPALIGAQQYLQWGIFMPQLRDAAEGEMLRQRRERIASTCYVNVGDAAPAFEVTDVDGRNFSAGPSHKKVVLVNFFAKWCGPCLQELPRMQKIWDRYGDNENLAMLIVGREESRDAVINFRSAHGYTFPAASDPQGELFSKFAKQMIPRTYLISPDGRILFLSVGYYEDELGRLERLLADRLESTATHTQR